jgi:quinol monooxygenase YgiN
MELKMIIASLKVTISPERHGDALQLVRAILGPTRAQSGCAGISFYQDTDEPETLVLLEEWEDWSSLENHIRSESFRYLLALMDLSTGQPEIRLNRVSKTEGMEVIEKLRMGS